MAATVAATPFDHRFAVDLQRPGPQSDQLLQNGATTFRELGSPGTVIAGPAIYLVGRLVHSPNATDLGLHETEAVFVASALSYLLKGLVGRARPYAVGDSVPDDFGFGRGFSRGSAYSSFPSGHTVAAFAFAATFVSESARWWPHSTWYVAPLMYGGATLVGLSRMYNNDHWGSDIIAAAAIGTFTGRKIVQRQHTRSQGLADGDLLPTAVVPNGSGGMLVLWSVWR